MTKQGKVYLIGAGPGDPGLLSIKAMECLQTADAVVYDRLADPRILAYAKDNAEMVYVGKASANHTMRQPDINKLLVKLAAEGKTVARLKGGDPFVFGRGGEEAIEAADDDGQIYSGGGQLSIDFTISHEAPSFPRAGVPSCFSWCRDSAG